MLLVLTGFCVYISGLRTGGFTPNTYDSVETLNQVFGKDLRTLPALYDWQNKYEVRLIFTEMLVPIWTGPILAAFIVGQDFANRSITLPLLMGYTRTRTYLGKALFYFLAGLALSHVALYLTLFLNRPDWMQTMNAAVYLRLILFRTLADLATLSIPWLAAFLFRDLIKTMAVSGGYAALLTFLNASAADNPNFLIRMIGHHPAFSIREMCIRYIPFPSDSMEMLLIALSMIALSSAVSYLIFCKSEMK
ncbi:MAG: hypothetical protein E7458_02970 [Ruminococcaceae bacterium]|nr:hypothetical protein [Oscillospiraceae bacterium]